MASIDNRKPTNKDIYVYLGDVFDLGLIVTKDDESAYTLTGKVITMTIKKTKTGTAVLTMVSPTDITISGDDGNVITFNKVLSTLSERSYHYDIQIDDDNYTIQYGMLIVTGETS